MQRGTLLATLLLLVLSMRGSVVSARRAASYVEAPELVQLRRQGNDLYRAGRFAAALPIYEQGLEAARRHEDRRSAIRFLNNLGSADYRLRRYRDAVKRYIEARKLASDERDSEMLATSSLNLSSLYLQLGEVDSAREAAERALAVRGGAGARFRADQLIHLAQIELQKPDCAGAVRLLRQAAEAARDRADLVAEAQSWTELGNALLDCGRTGEAEGPLIEGYRLRKLTRDPRLPSSYESLAELMLAEDNAPAALRFADLASAAGGADGWRERHRRGRIHRALGQSADAYADFRTAVARVNDWRGETLPGDAFRIRSEVDTRRVYSDFIAAAGELYQRTHTKQYAEEAFEAAEDGRAASLRALWARSDRPKQLPEDYWRTLADMQRAEADLVRGLPDDGRVERYRARLSEMEVVAGLDLPAGDSGDVHRRLPAAQRALAADEAYIGFHTAEGATWTWAVTRESFGMAEARPESDLGADVGRFVGALREGQPQAVPIGRALFASLFAQLGPLVQAKRRWTVAPDGALFDLPLAALTTGDGFLIERHSLRLTPGLYALLGPARPAPTDLFLGVGDPVYNRADPRRPPKWSGPAATLELPRLPGSGREVEACARVWRDAGGPALLLEGLEANKRRLADAVASRPAVVHVASHMLFPGQGGERGMLALSVEDRTGVELLSDTEVAGMTTKVGLVVLNGCSSGRGAVLPGAGLMGMTRAWLAAGAGAVIATRWPAPDQDSGAIFESLYRLYQDRRKSGSPVSFGELLCDAQRAELRRGGGGASPARWAAYFSVERN